jgi:DNA circularisation protein N-terminus
MADPFVATVPANVSVNVNDLFQGLLGLTWRGIGVPYTDMHLSLRQDLAIHKFADRDGAHIEGTGRAPLEIRARLAFINQLGKGTNERWQQPLYPTQWRKFFEACADRSSDILQHPELGEISCKPQSCETVWAGGVRGGVYVDAVWIESDDTGADLISDLAAPSPISALASACANLDTDLGEINPVVTPSLPQPVYTFTDLANAIRSVGDQTAVLQASFAGRINTVINQCQQVEMALAAPGVSNSLNWPIYQQAELAKDAANNLRANLLTTGDPVSVYTVTKDSTLPQVAATLGTNLQLLINLNPSLLLSPIVPQNTRVRYYPLAA